MKENEEMVEEMKRKEKWRMKKKNDNNSERKLIKAEQKKNWNWMTKQWKNLKKRIVEWLKEKEIEEW